MGCGGSRLDHKADILPLPAKIRPLLWRRYEEIKKHKKASILKDSASLSKKELLKDGASEDDKSMSSVEDNVKVAPTPESVQKTIVILKVDKPVESKEGLDKECKNIKEDIPQDATLLVEFQDVESNIISKQIEAPATTIAEPQNMDSAAPDGNQMSNKKDSEHGDKDGEDKTLEVITAAMTNANVIEIDRDGDVHIEDNDDDEEEDGRLSSMMSESYICPGSPSFRVYFLESLANANDADEDEDDDTDKKSSGDDTDKKWATDQDSSKHTESTGSNELLGTIEKKKGKRGRRFRRVIQKGNPAAVKNLLNVKSCYHPRSSGQKSRLDGHKEVS